MTRAEKFTEVCGWLSLLVAGIVVTCVLLSLAACEPDRLAFCAKYTSIVEDYAACARFDYDCAWAVRMAQSDLQRHDCASIQVRE